MVQGQAGTSWVGLEDTDGHFVEKASCLEIVNSWPLSDELNESKGGTGTSMVEISMTHVCKVKYKSLVSKPPERVTMRRGGHLQLGKVYHPFRLCEILSTALARRIVTVQGVPARNAQHPVTATRAAAIRPKRRACGMVVIPRTMVIGASQLYTILLFLRVESLLQPKLERVNTVRERSIGDVSDVFVHEGNRIRVFEVRGQKIPLHPYDFLMT